MEMLPLKLVRSLVLGDTINHNPLLPSQNHHNSNTHNVDDNNNDPTTTTTTKTAAIAGRRRRKAKMKVNINQQDQEDNTRIALLLFLPTKELVSDTYRLATIARDMGMDLHPTPSLSHIIFSYPSSTSSSLSSPSPSAALSWSSLSLASSLSCVLPNHAVLLTFPSLASSSLSHLRSFVSLSKGLFKLVFLATDLDNHESKFNNFNGSNWDCCSISLFSRITGDRIDSMEAFCRALTGAGWTLFKTKKNPSQDSSDPCICGGKSVYLFRKIDSGRVRARRGSGECRIRELRLPTLDFRNAPLRILQYVVLMTDDVFYLA